MYTLLWLAASIVPRLPRWSIPLLSSAIGSIVWLVARSARKQATINMAHVLNGMGYERRGGGNPRGRPRVLRKIVRGMFRNNVRNYLEAFTLPYIRTETIVKSVQPEGIEHLEAALARGKGVLLFSAHFGPFDYLSQWIVAKGYQLAIPVEHLKDQRILDLMLRLRRSHGVQYVPLTGNSTMRKMLSALRSNQIVLITADRVVQGESVEVPFFGAAARLPLGPVQLAQRTGATLVGAFGWRTSPTGELPMEGKFVPLSLRFPEEQRTNIDTLMGGIVETLEQIIGAHPDQWVVFSPVWTDASS